MCYVYTVRTEYVLLWLRLSLVLRFVSVVSVTVHTLSLGQRVDDFDYKKDGIYVYSSGSSYIFLVVSYVPSSSLYSRPTIRGDGFWFNRGRHFSSQK